MTAILAQLQLLLATIAPFFGVQLFIILMIVLGIDYLTGVIRAASEKRYRHPLLAISPMKALLYTVYYVVVHGTVLYLGGGLVTLPVGIEEMLLLPPLAKELISILQNLKAISIVHNIDATWLDFAIRFLRLDVYQAALDELKKVTTAPEDGEQKPQTDRQESSSTET